MQGVSNDTFGPLIAYLVPGATALVGLSPFLPAVRAWLASTPGDAPTIGGFLFLTVASVAAGMTLSAVRWATVDRVLSRTGVPPPPADFSRLGANVEGLRLLIEIHYRHYQFYANMVVATAVAWAAHRAAAGWAAPAGAIDLTALALAPVFFATARDTLCKYHNRTRHLLASPPNPTPAAPARAAGRTRGGSRPGRRARPAAG